MNIKTILREELEQQNLILLETNNYMVLYDGSFRDLDINGIVGVIVVEKVENGLYHIPVIPSEKGFGHIMYKIAMSKVYPSYITSDRFSNTSDQALKTLLRLKSDSNIETDVMSPENKNYVLYPKKSDEFHILRNTIYKIKTPINLNQYNPNKIIKEPNEDSILDSFILGHKNYGSIIDKLAFRFFQKKLE